MSHDTPEDDLRRAQWRAVQLEAEVAALRARLEAAEQERDEWARVAVGADHDRAGEYGERLEAEERLAAAEERSVRLAEALRDVGGQDATGDRICWCDGGPEHAPECDDARTALAEHDAAAKGEG